MKKRQQSLVIPLLFISIYGSGFVAAKLGLAYTEPLTFLALRFTLAATILGIAAYIMKTTWRLKNIGWLLCSGLLLQGVFSIGTFYALYFDIKSAVSALVISLQPLLVAVFSGFYLDERVSVQRWLGLLLGVVGVSIIVADGLTTEGLSVTGLVWVLVALLGLALGQLIQKKHCADMNLWVGGCIQTASSAAVMICLAAFFEVTTINWSVKFVGALVWMSAGVSVGAVSLLYLMLRSREASQVSSVFYGVPIAAAFLVWPFFGQVPTVVDWLGFAVVMAGFILANHSFSVPAKHTSKPQNKFTGGC